MKSITASFLGTLDTSILEQELRDKGYIVEQDDVNFELLSEDKDGARIKALIGTKNVEYSEFNIDRTLEVLVDKSCMLIKILDDNVIKQALLLLNNM